MDVSIKDGICVVKRVLLNANSVRREKHHLLMQALTSLLADTCCSSLVVMRVTRMLVAVGDNSELLAWTTSLHYIC